MTKTAPEVAYATGGAGAHVPVDKSQLIDKKTRLRALGGSAVGSAVEWYDYFLYGTMSGLVFGPLFFPAESATASQMLALASFALAFVIRPIGGIVFSHIGDRIGRKKTLVVTLTLMGVATVAIGLMPTYAQIGAAAPILLTVLRLIQGLALGGEWGGGLLMAVEYSPKKSRGLYGAVPQTGALFGLALGNLAVVAADGIFTEEQFLSFGWRIPFLLSVVLVAVGLWIRNKVAETPSFQKVKDSGTTAKVPLVETLKNHWRQVLVVIGAKFIETSTFFIFATFTVSYAVSLGFTRGEALNAVLIAAVVAIPVMLGVGSLSDRVGRKKMFVAGTVAVMIYIVPFFWMINQGSAVLLTIACVLGFGVIWSMYGAVLGTLFAESFSADVRYTGASLGYQIGAALVGGPAPLIATALLTAFTGSYIPIGLFVVACGIVSLIAVRFARERAGQDLDD
ncbi:MFS transporter [Georgenia yuyongxinii]|uniref:Putative proline/betaine transporter n=1 Tax=Georgenia yuyongxinii TaxID=2589797 RepID=A0A552WJZ4_9MICO|nr:MFS transporter [Georgenia yuyongxinii]TRW43085.1 MHS family MFS transporter [Georgenia yuyongxinii]